MVAVCCLIIPGGAGAILGIVVAALLQEGPGAIAARGAQLGGGPAFKWRNAAIPIILANVSLLVGVKIGISALHWISKRTGVPSMNEVKSMLRSQNDVT
jgi:hypothetical protein